MTREDAIFAGATFAALLLAMDKARAPPSPGIDVTFPPAPVEPAPVIVPQSPNPAVDQASANEVAFLQMIRFAEHLAEDVQSGQDFFVGYGGARFSGVKDHPILTGELKPVPLPPEVCRRAGYLNGVCKSTAAGAFQINVPTWNDFRSGLPDFSPASQMEAARRILAKLGALDAIRSGDFASAVKLASIRWASLPGSTVGQNARSMDYVLSRFMESGGVVA